MDLLQCADCEDTFSTANGFVIIGKKWLCSACGFFAIWAGPHDVKSHLHQRDAIGSEDLPSF